MKTLVALLALVALFGCVGLFGASLALGPCAGLRPGRRVPTSAAVSRAEAIKALIDGLRRCPGMDDREPGPSGGRAVVVYDEPGDPQRPVTGRLDGGRWEVRARDCRTGREWRFLLFEAEGGETVVILRQ